MRVFHGSAIGVKTPEIRIGKFTKDFGEERLSKIYKLADIYHSDNIARVADDLIKECYIENDYFDVTNVKFAVPTHWDIAKVYKRLIISVSQDNQKHTSKPWSLSITPG